MKVPAEEIPETTVMGRPTDEAGSGQLPGCAAQSAVGSERSSPPPFLDAFKAYVPGGGDDWHVRVKEFCEALYERWPPGRRVWPLADEGRFIAEMQRRHILQFSESDRRRFIDSRFASELGRWLNNRVIYGGRDPWRDPPTPERPLILPSPPPLEPGWHTVLPPMYDSGGFDRVRFFYDKAADRLDWFVESWIPEERTWRRESLPNMEILWKLQFHAPARAAELWRQGVPLSDWCDSQLEEVETPPSPS